MITLELSLDDLLRSRFAISVVGEVLEAGHAIANPAPAAGYSGWQREQEHTLQRLARDHDLRPLFALLPACSYITDFLMPLPRSPVADLEAELAGIRATPVARARAEIDRCLRGRDPIEPDVERLWEALKARIDVLDARVRSSLTALQDHVAGIVQRYTAATIASLTGYAYLLEAVHAL